MIEAAKNNNCKRTFIMISDSLMFDLRNECLNGKTITQLRC
jgi:hypothetical protein